MNFSFLHVYELFQIVNSWVLNLISSSGYPGLGFVMFLENVFPPIPSEIILPMAGSLISAGDFSLAGITLVGMIGSVAGAWVFYGIGFFVDEKRVRSFIQKFGKWFFLSTADLDRALEWFKKYGNLVIFFGRMVPMVRSLISIPAGLAKMNWAKFTLYSALGTALWSFCLALAGQVLGNNWKLVEVLLNKYDIVVWAALVLAIFFFLFKRITLINRTQNS